MMEYRLYRYIGPDNIQESYTSHTQGLDYDGKMNALRKTPMMMGVNKNGDFMDDIHVYTWDIRDFALANKRKINYIWGGKS